MEKGVPCHKVSKATLPTTLKSTAMAVVDYLSKSMMSALPFIVCALFRTVAVISGRKLARSVVCRFRYLSPVLQLAL